MLISRQDVYQFAAACAHDDVHIGFFRDALIECGLWKRMGAPAPKVQRNVPPPACPLIPDMTAIRCALFDNWPDGRFIKGTPNRYGLQMDVWTLPADQIEAVNLKGMNQSFKSAMSLMDRKALRAQIKSLRKPRKQPLTAVSPEYLDALLMLSDGAPEAVFGMVNTNIKHDDDEHPRGIYYHPLQFVMLMIEDGQVTDAKLAIDDQVIDLAPFVSTDHAGNELRGNVVAQSRTDIIGFDEDWQS